MAIFDSLISASDSFIKNPVLLKIVTSIIILFIGFIFGRIAGKIILKVLKKIEFDKTIKRATGYESSIASIISKTVSFLIYFATVLIFLESLGLTSIVLNIVLVVILLIIGISAILAIKDFIPNFMAGYSLRSKGLFKTGDKIKVGNIEGKIIKINLLDTHVNTNKNDLMVIPNSFFIKNVVVKKK